MKKNYSNLNSRIMQEYTASGEIQFCIYNNPKALVKNLKTERGHSAKGKWNSLAKHKEKVRKKKYKTK